MHHIVKDGTSGSWIFFSFLDKKILIINFKNQRLVGAVSHVSHLSRDFTCKEGKCADIREKYKNWKQICECFEPTWQYSAVLF